VAALFASALFGFAYLSHAQSDCTQWDEYGYCVSQVDSGSDPSAADWLADLLADWLGKRGGGTATDVVSTGSGYSGTVHFADGDVTFANDNGTWINDALGYSSAQSLLQAIVVAGSSHGGSVTTTVNSAGVLTGVACNNGVTASIAGAEESCASNQGASCTSAPNSCGMVNGGGTIQCNGSCSASVPSDSQCPVTTVTPPANTGTGTNTNNNCVSNAGSACTSAPNICGMTNNSGTIQCNGSCNAGVPSNSLCQQQEQEDSCVARYHCIGNSIYYIDAQCNDTLQRTCVAPSYCVNGSSVCVSPAINVVTHLKALPLLVAQGTPTRLYWEVENAGACRVSGDNGDEWSASSSGAGGVVSSGLNTTTTFTLSCTPSSSSVVETQVVHVAPTYQEL